MGNISEIILYIISILNIPAFAKQPQDKWHRKCLFLSDENITVKTQTK